MFGSAALGEAEEGTGRGGSVIAHLLHMPRSPSRLRASRPLPVRPSSSRTPSRSGGPQRANRAAKDDQAPRRQRDDPGGQASGPPSLGLSASTKVTAWNTVSAGYVRLASEAVKCQRISPARRHSQPSGTEASVVTFAASLSRPLSLGTDGAPEDRTARRVVARAFEPRHQAVALGLIGSSGLLQRPPPRPVLVHAHRSPLIV